MSVTEAVNTFWVIIAAALVFFMQAGFAMVETGLTRAKNANNIIMKNLLDFSIGAIVFWFVGWGIMYGHSPNSSVSGFIGTKGFLFSSATHATLKNWIFQVVFAAAAATIVSGAMSERTRFVSYLIYSVFISGFIYPVLGHWIWSGDGWLNKLGFFDFAGSTVVHSTGGWAALMGAVVLGPRIGKYVRLNGKVEVKAIRGHNMPLAALGVFILWFGWFGFNGGSTLSAFDSRIPLIIVTTTIAASAGALSAMILSWFLYGKPDPSMSLNGVLAGLVGITAGCAVVTPFDAVVIGVVAGFLVVISIEIIDKIFHIDDPVGAVSVHGVCGVWGTLAVGLFANTPGMKGLFFGGGFRQLGIQTLGAFSVFVWVILTTTLLFYSIKLTVGLRVHEDEELRGLDIDEHGLEAYSGFQIFQNM